MRPPSAVTTSDALTFLRVHLGRDVEALEWVGEGAWSRCFGFLDGGREWVIRFGRYLDDFENDRRAASFRSAALPVPHVSEIGRAFDGYFAISTRARGVPLESLTEDPWRAVLPSLFAALDAARAVELSVDSGWGGWNADGVAPQRSWREFLLAVEQDTPDQRTHGWRQRLIDSPVGDATLRAGLAKLAALADECAPEKHLVHSDLINRNVLVAADCITGVFDWGCSLHGDFLYDIAWLEFWAPWHEGLAAIDIRSEAARHYDASGLDVPDLEVRLRCCGIHIGLSHQAYCAHTGQLRELVAVTDRLVPLLD